MRRSVNKFVLVSTLLMFCSCGILAFGQGTSASLTGQITDATGAAVAGANVTAKNTDTNLARTSISNGDGVYIVSPLPPGNYSLTVEAKGFQRYIQQGIVLAVDVSATQNVSLKAGSVQQTVTVTEEAELINTTTAELGTTVNQAAITQLPLNGRDPSSLVLLAPGTTSVTAPGGQGGGMGGQPGVQSGFSFPTETGASASGGRQGSTYYLLDGVPHMDNYTLLDAPFPNADAIEEFRVITNNFNALYGFAPGAVVSIETKSGSNKFHGGVFEFLRNKDLNASNSYFDPTSSSPDPLRRNQFGGYVGGPIIKDKLFGFFNYQGTRNNSAALANRTQTPTAAMLGGTSAESLRLSAREATRLQTVLLAPLVGSRTSCCLGFRMIRLQSRLPQPACRWGSSLMVPFFTLEAHSSPVLTNTPAESTSTSQRVSGLCCAALPTID